MSRNQKVIFIFFFFPHSLEKKMEDLKEMFAQMIKLQMESQQKNEKKLLQLQKENEERILKNEEKQQQFFLELQKQQETLFKSLSNNQPTDSTTIFTQNVMWNALETFSYAPDEDKTFEAYYRRYEDIYITDSANWTDAKKSSATFTKARNCGTQRVRRLYLTKKKKNLRTWILETVRIIQLQNVSIPQKMDMSQFNKKEQWWLFRVCPSRQ